jgi:hypothetical protein
MYLIVNANKQFWDGSGWAEQGKTFLTVASAARSLHEEGEDPFEVTILELDDSTKKNSTRSSPTF